MSHIVVIRGGEYGQAYDPEEGHVSVEIRYNPSHSLSNEQVGNKVTRIKNLLDKLYAIEGEEVEP